jgi:hypothetical protein
MRLPPHVPSQTPLRLLRSALRFSQARLRQKGSCSALSLLACPSLQETVPFRRKGAAGLTERIDVRVAPAEKAQLRGIARDAGIAVSELVRLRALGQPVVCRTDATTIRELRRLGGLLKKVHLDSGGAYSEATAGALTALRAAIEELGDGRWGREAGRPL